MGNKILETYIVLVTDSQFGETYKALRKCYLLENGSYILEEDNGKGTRFRGITKDDFLEFSTLNF